MYVAQITTEALWLLYSLLKTYFYYESGTVWWKEYTCSLLSYVLHHSLLRFQSFRVDKWPRIAASQKIPWQIHQSCLLEWIPTDNMLNLHHPASNDRSERRCWMYKSSCFLSVCFMYMSVCNNSASLYTIVFKNLIFFLNAYLDCIEYLDPKLFNSSKQSNREPILPRYNVKTPSMKRHQGYYLVSYLQCSMQGKFYFLNCFYSEECCMAWSGTLIFKAKFWFFP